MDRTKSFCLHAETRAVDMPQGSRHWKALECAHCGAHLRFLPWPEHLQQRKVNLRKLEWLLRHVPEEATELEEAAFFIEVADAAGRLSPSQQAAFDEICAKYGADQNGAAAQEEGGGL